MEGFFAIWDFPPNTVADRLDNKLSPNIQELQECLGTDQSLDM